MNKEELIEILGRAFGTSKGAMGEIAKVIRIKTKNLIQI
jgi:hypothetical protein